VIGRKAGANLHVRVGSPLSLLLVVAAVAAVWLVRPGGLLRGGVLPAGDRSPLRAGLAATGLSLAIGAVVNDSGVAVPAAAAALLVPLGVALAARCYGGSPWIDRLARVNSGSSSTTPSRRSSSSSPAGSSPRSARA
jgi:hypothetical protein